MNPRRIVTKGLLDRAFSFDELPPIHRIDQGQTRDAVPHRDPIGALRAAVCFQEPRRARAPFHQLLFDPRDDESHDRSLFLEPSEELIDERSRKRHVRRSQLGEDTRQTLRRLVGRLLQASGPGDRRVAILATAGDARDNAAQILEKRQSQHDRERPELADAQRLDTLVGRHETRDRFRIDTAIDVGDQLEGHVVHPRKSSRGSFGQLRELPAVTGRKVTSR